MSYRAACAFCMAATMGWHHPTPVIQESRDHEQLPTRSKRAHMQEKCAKMRSWSCCFTLNSAPFLLIPSLAKSQHIHFPCLDMGSIIIIWKAEQQKKKKEKSMPKLIRINSVITVLEYLYNTEGPFNWSVYMDRQASAMAGPLYLPQQHLTGKGSHKAPIRYLYSIRHWKRHAFQVYNLIRKSRLMGVN